MLFKDTSSSIDGKRNRRRAGQRLNKAIQETPEHSNSKGTAGFYPLGRMTFFVFFLRKIGPELTSVPIFLHFICGTPATAWRDNRCIGLCLGSELANPGPPKQSL